MTDRTCRIEQQTKRGTIVVFSDFFQYITFIRYALFLSLFFKRNGKTILINSVRTIHSSIDVAHKIGIVIL